MSYSEFVKSTFAYTHKKYRTECATEICSAEMPTAISENISVLEQFQDLQHKHDIIHCGYGILNEFVEYMNEFIKYINIIETLENTPPSAACVQITADLDKQLVAIKKEIGDIYYYKTMLLNLLDIDQPITDIEWDAPNEGITVEALADLIKKFVYYSHELNVPAIKQACFDMDRCFNSVCRSLSTTLPDIIAQNEEKLRKRYPSGTFTSQEAAAKADTHD